MKRSEALTWTELRVGIVVVASLAILAFAILSLGGGRAAFAETYELKAQMADVNGLKPGAPVRVGGVDVGSVTHVGFGGEGAHGLVEVTMRLDRRVQERVTTESEASLGALGLLGEKAVDIAAAPSGVPIGDGGYVRGASGDPFKGLLSDSSEATSALKRILSRMDAGEGLIGKALREEELYDRMLDVSVRMQGVMGKLEAERGPLGRLMNDESMASDLAQAAAGLGAASRRVEAGEGVLGALSSDPGLAGDVRSLAASLRQVAEGLESGRGSLGKLLQEGGLHERTERLLARLERVTANLETGEGTARRLLEDPELYVNLNGALADLRRLIADVRRDPKRYLRVKVSLF